MEAPAFSNWLPLVAPRARAVEAIMVVPDVLDPHLCAGTGHGVTSSGPPQRGLKKTQDQEAGSLCFGHVTRWMIQTHLSGGWEPLCETPTYPHLEEETEFFTEK
ncbi:hypothetical protein NDU88_003374 [Pleurodeles waltl]|uniref:Uncharacterized protein n=1 Tax=Pleurodeles waltl TaxID=8319 RepID=A0AAV7RCQ1_PLEWA|nr:hypothetical protein NDU88_003374 [Pleurodeles waltl]